MIGIIVHRVIGYQLILLGDGADNEDLQLDTQCQLSSSSFLRYIIDNLWNITQFEGNSVLVVRAKVYRN